MSRDEYGRQFVHPDDMWVFQQVAEKRLASTDREFLLDAEHRIVRRDGEVRTSWRAYASAGMPQAVLPDITGQIRISQSGNRRRRSLSLPSAISGRP